MFMFMEPIEPIEPVMEPAMDPMPLMGLMLYEAEFMFMVPMPEPSVLPIVVMHDMGPIEFICGDIEFREEFIPAKLEFIWFRLAFMLLRGFKLFCMILSCALTMPPLTLGWHGLPSLTNTGTATLRGEGSGFNSCNPFSCRARFSL